MNGELDDVTAELMSVVRTADLIAHDGLQPDSDGPRVLAGLISQLGGQLLRVVQATAVDPRPSTGELRPSDDGAAPEDGAVPEEDISPEEAPAEPSRPV